MMKRNNRGRLGRRRILSAAGLGLALPAIVARAQSTQGVALVIGNSKYRWEASLPNVKRDVPDIARAFEAMAFKTELLEDVGLDAMRRALDRFKAATHGANVAAFYFAGHGVTWQRRLYLVPADADLSDPKAVQSLVLSQNVGAAMRPARYRLGLLDNCRNNPAGGWRQTEALGQAWFNSLANRVAAEIMGPNSLALYATAPGQVALDGPAGENSPFARAVLRQLSGESIELQSLPGKVRRDLLIATSCRQMAFDFNTYNAPVYLKGPAKASPLPDPPGIVGLDKAYTFARQNGLVLPSGLIGFRRTNSPASQRVGSYQCTINQSPALLVVMSVNGDTTAEVVVAAIDQAAGGANWRFATANFSGDRLTFIDQGETYQSEFKWRDADSGSYSFFPTALGASSRPLSGHFSRLDG